MGRKIKSYHCAVTAFDLERGQAWVLRFKSRDESVPKLKQSWRGVKMDSGPKRSHSHIREPVLVPIWPKSHGGDGAEIEPVPETFLSKAGADAHSGDE